MTKLSVVISTLGNRWALLERTLYAMCRWQNYSPDEVELVVVVDTPRDHDEFVRVLQQYSFYFYKTQLIGIDSRKYSVIPVGPPGNPALGMNVGVKAAENEIIFKTDAECLPITTTIEAALVIYDQDRLQFCSARTLSEAESEQFTLDALGRTVPSEILKGLVDLPGLWTVHHKYARNGYWFGSVFSRSKFMEIGGVDEQFMQGFAGEDDDWALRMIRVGVHWDWPISLVVAHQYHGQEQRKFEQSAFHWMNINRLHETHADGHVVANVGHEWGSEGAVTSKTQFENGRIVRGNYVSRSRQQTAQAGPAVHAGGEA
jgi:hypothetical protein